MLKINNPVRLIAALLAMTLVGGCTSLGKKSQDASRDKTNVASINWNNVKETHFDITPFIGLAHGGDSPTKNSSIRSGLNAGDGFPLTGVGFLRHMDEMPVAWWFSYYLHDSYYTPSNQDSSGKYVSTGEDDSFPRTPIEVLAFYKAAERFRIGGGLRYVHSSTAKIVTPDPGGGPAQTEEVKFGSTTGKIIEARYRMDSSKPMGAEWWLGIRYVKEEYKVASDVQNGVVIPASKIAGYSTVNGSHIALILYAAF